MALEFAGNGCADILGSMLSVLFTSGVYMHLYMYVADIPEVVPPTGASCEDNCCARTKICEFHVHLY